MTNETRRPNRTWMWFFVLLGVLTISGIGWEVWFNQQQQLTPGQLDSARQLWIENGPRDYRLDYTIKREVNADPAGVAAERYSVEVHDGKIMAVYGPDKKILDPDELDPGDYEFDSMDGLFAIIAERLRADAQPGKPRAFVTATFDAKDGHVVHYVRSIMQTRERLEVRIKLVRETARRD